MTGQHLAEKILTSRSALEGERKQVTVLFADLKGFDDRRGAENSVCQKSGATRLVLTSNPL
jgi:class 3 adenylate cyclase